MIDEGLQNRLQKLDLSSKDAISEGLNGQTILAAFAPEAPPKARAIVTLGLSQVAADGGNRGITSLIADELTIALKSSEDGKKIAALRLLSTVYALSPAEAHELLLGQDGLWRLVVPKIDVESSSEVDFVKAEMICAAANHGTSRKQLSSHQEVIDWLGTAASSSAAAKASTDEVALVASLALYKLQMGSSADSATQSPSEHAQTRARPVGREDSKQLQQRLLKLSKAQVVAAETTTMARETSRSAVLSGLEALSYISAESNVKEAVVGDVAFLAALCNLPSKVGQAANKKTVFPSRNAQGNTSDQTSSYNLDSTLEQKGNALAQADSSLQLATSTILLHLVAYPAHLSQQEKQMAKLRKMAAAQNNKVRPSDEQEDPLETMQAVDRRNVLAVEAGAAKCLVEITTAMVAGIQSKASVSYSLSSSRALRETLSRGFLSLVTKQDRAHRGKVAQAGAVKALVSLSSQAIADLIATAKAEEASPRTGADVFSSSDPSGESAGLSPIQALAKLSITSSPAILFGSPITATSALLPFLTTLYLHPSASILQRFEALLALTNVASLSPEAAHAVAVAGLRSDLVSKDAQNQGATATTILAGVEDTILLEDDNHLRRAAVELLCNLVQDDVFFKRWSGEQAEEDAEKNGNSVSGAVEAKVRNRLHLLVALCSPGASSSSSSSSSSTAEANPQKGDPDSLALRLASSGTLATLASSPCACAALLSLEVRTLNIIARCIDAQVPYVGKAAQSDKFEMEGSIREISDADAEAASNVQEGADDDEDDDETSAALDSQLHLLDLSASPHSAAHAELSLSLRSITLAWCQVQYLSWLLSAEVNEVQKGRRGIQKMVQSGIVEGVRRSAVKGAEELKRRQNGGNSSTATGGTRTVKVSTAVAAAAEKDMEEEALRLQVTQVAFECLKMLGGLGVDVSGNVG